MAQPRQYCNHYLPKVVVNHLHEKEQKARRKGKDKAFLTAEFEQKVAVVLFADVSGFTKMAEKLAIHGDSEKRKLGTEALALELNTYMTQILRMVIKSGGDVIKFAGDAMVCTFPSKFSVKQEHEDEAMAEHATLCNAAIQVAINMQNIPYINEYEFKKDFVPKVDKQAMLLANNIESYLGIGLFNDSALYYDRIRLRVKFGIGLGRINVLYIGGASDNSGRNRYEYVAVGPALDHAYAAEAKCDPGGVVVHRKVWKRVKEDKMAKKQGYLRFNFHPYIKENIDTNRDTQFYKLDTKKNKDLSKTELINLDPEKYKLVSDETLMSFIPLAVLPYVREQDRKVENWGNELRRITTLFIQMGLTDDDLAKITNSEDIETSRLQQTFKMVQEDTYRYQGTINKFLIDDKGSTLIVVFGLPPFAHDDDAVRGVLCSMDILDTLNRQKLKGYGGISSGVSFCGVVGNSSGRREYSVIGDRVNLAARLMGEAPKENTTLVIDRSTRTQLTDDRLTRDFRRIIVKVKGKTAKQEVYKYMGRIHELSDAKLLKVGKIEKNISVNARNAVISFVIPCKESKEKKGPKNSESKEKRSPKKSYTERPSRIYKKKSGNKNEEPQMETSNKFKITVRIKKDATVGDLKEEALKNKNLPDTVTDMFSTNAVMLWESGGDPEFSMVPPVFVDDNTSVDLLRNNDPYLYFSIMKNPSGGKATTPMDLPTARNSIKFIQREPRRTATGAVRGDIQDTFSIIHLLKREKHERIQSKTGLKIIVLEGSYGVGRTKAVRQVFGDKKLKKQKVEIISSSASRFVEKDEEICNIWKTVLNKLLYNRLRKSGHKPKAVVSKALEAARNLFRQVGLPPNMTNSDKQYHSMEATAEEYLKDILSFDHTRENSGNWPVLWNKTHYLSPFVCDKDDMKTVFKNDTSLTGSTGPGKQKRRSILNVSIPQKTAVKRRLSNTFGGKLNKNKHQRKKDTSEQIVHFISGLICGLVLINKNTPLVIMLDHAENMDPFSWLILHELSQWWSRANISIIVSMRNMMTNADLRQGTKPAPTPFSRHSIRGRLISEQVDEENHFIKHKTHGRIPMLLKQEESPHSKYPYLNRIEDRNVLINTLRTHTKTTQFIEVRSNVKHTETLLLNMLEIEQEHVDPRLLEYFERKSNGMPLIIKDGLHYFKFHKVINVTRDIEKGCNVLQVDHKRFDKVIDDVPQSVEAISGMILDTLSLTGQIALKVAACLHRNFGEFSLEMVREVFKLQTISTEGMQEKLESDWGTLVYSRTIVPLDCNGRTQRKPIASDKFKFVFEWMRDSLEKRLLSGQLSIIENAIKTQGEKPRAGSRSPPMKHRPSRAGSRSPPMKHRPSRNSSISNPLYNNLKE